MRSGGQAPAHLDAVRVIATSYRYQLGKLAIRLELLWVRDCMSAGSAVRKQQALGFIVQQFNIKSLRNAIWVLTVRRTW